VPAKSAKATSSAVLKAAPGLCQRFNKHAFCNQLGARPSSGAESVMLICWTPMASDEFMDGFSDKVGGHASMTDFPFFSEPHVV
jgi:hypothetical protein